MLGVEPRSPYQPPRARLAGEDPHYPPTAVYVFAALAVPLALWYLAVDARRWFDADPFDLMTAEEMGVTGVTWVTRALYCMPKLGVVVGLISLLKFPRYSGLVYLACWMFALAHTAMYYRDFHVPIQGEIEWLRLVVHHVIPHLFFACMVLSLLWFRWRRSGRTKSDIPGL